jgi:antitoxin component of RelBE/YafQ-DinJ toxin-antitoxin module
MPQTQDELTVHIDSDVRANAEVFFRRYGLNLSAAINALLREAIAKKINPLEIDAEIEGNAHVYDAGLAEQWAKEDPDFCKEAYKQDPFFNKMNQADIRQADAEFKAGKGVRYDPRKEKAPA